MVKLITGKVGAEGCSNIQTVRLLVLVMNQPTLKVTVRPSLQLIAIPLATIKVGKAIVRRNPILVGKMNALLIYTGSTTLPLQNRLETCLRGRNLIGHLRWIKAMKIVCLVECHSYWV